MNLLLRLLSALVVATLLTGCIGPDRDTDLESAVSELVDAEEVFAISTFGNVVVTVTSNSPFDMGDEERAALALQIARLTFVEYPDANAIVIGFAALPPQGLHVAYAWRVVDGVLERVEELGGKIVSPGRQQSSD